ncbi:trypsin alpha-3 [Biomphalaria pfeifferi]|uniref:Trypsin alpha-3 n=2 Tax=Biomphalaria pfeifferi TaxID=112525 RepID=A0AAD8FAB9_BIOPF|nr:trypsin alpha-3 [Biomphalaria pfeifferi]
MISLAVVLLFVSVSFGDVVPNRIHLPDIKNSMFPRTFNGSSNSRIINGEISKMFSRPYQASLQVLYQNVLHHICGAVIIAPDVLVCAAHCLVVYPVEWLRIEVGSLSLTSNASVYTQFLDVESVKPHEDYRAIVNEEEVFPNDIGLIFLKRRMTFNANVQPILIASPFQSFDNEICVISGWGRTYYGSPKTADLREANMRKWPYQQCQDVHQEIGTSVNKNQICVKGESDDGLPPGACQGDSGGPLACGHRFLLGVASYVFDKCSVEDPSVYTRVPGYYTWIIESIFQHSFPQ